MIVWYWAIQSCFEFTASPFWSPFNMRQQCFLSAGRTALPAESSICGNVRNDPSAVGNVPERRADAGTVAPRGPSYRVEQALEDYILARASRSAMP